MKNYLFKIINEGLETERKGKGIHLKEGCTTHPNPPTPPPHSPAWSPVWCLSAATLRSPSLPADSLGSPCRRPWPCYWVKTKQPDSVVEEARDYLRPLSSTWKTALTSWNCRGQTAPSPLLDHGCILADPCPVLVLERREL